MDVETATSLGPAVVAAIIAIVVPLVAFRLAVYQDKVRWLREKRAEVYIDLLTEAYAEHQHLLHRLSDPETRSRFAEHFVDLRMGSVERARLGSRADIYASPRVRTAFNRMQYEGHRFTIGDRRGQELELADSELSRAFDALKRVVRDELGTERAKLMEPSKGGSRISRPD